LGIRIEMTADRGRQTGYGKMGKLGNGEMGTISLFCYLAIQLRFVESSATNNELGTMNKELTTTYLTCFSGM
jgi:hypothetical protein